MTTQRLDEIAEELIRGAGGIPAFKDYPGPTPYPASVCASVNDEVVHGIPGPYALREGDVLRSTSGSSSTAGSPTRRAPTPSARSRRSRGS